MNKNSNYDDTLINQPNNSGDTTIIDPIATPPPYNPGDFDSYNDDSSQDATYQPKRSSGKGIIAATAGIAFASGTAAAYGLGALDSNEDDPNLIAEAIGDGDLELNEDVAEVAKPDLDIDFTIGSDENVRSLGINITVPELTEIRLTTVPSDSMSFSEAFAAARRAVGPHGVFEWRGGVYGTYYENEWKHMPAEYKREFSNFDWRSSMSEMGDGEVLLPGEESISATVEINNEVIIQETEVSHSENQSTINIITDNGTSHATPSHSGIDYTIDDVLISTAPNDNMDFKTAFALARADVGPGGVFEWKGKTYNTFYETEWNNLSDSSKGSFEEYDWGSEIDKAKSQPSYLSWETMEFDEYGDPLAEIPTDPETGLPIDELNDYAVEASVIDDVEPVIYEPESSNLYATEAVDYDSVNESDNGFYTAEAYDDVEILNESPYQSSDVYVAEVIENDNAAVIEADYNVAEVADIYEPEATYEPTPEVYESPVVDDYSYVDDYSSTIDNTPIDDFCDDLNSI